MSYRMSRVVVGLSLVGTLVCSIACAILWMMSADAVAQVPAPSSQKTNSANSNANSNSEEAAVFERILNRVHFENDGPEVSETEAVVRIQSQAGAEEFGQLGFGDPSATQKSDLAHARVPNPNRPLEMPPAPT